MKRYTSSEIRRTQREALHRERVQRLQRVLDMFLQVDGTHEVPDNERKAREIEARIKEMYDDQG